MLSGDTTLLFWVAREQGTKDTTYNILTHAFGDADAAYTVKDQVPAADGASFQKGEGATFPLMDGIIKLDYLTEDIWWIDSLNGFDTLSTTYHYTGTVNGNITNFDRATNPYCTALRDSVILYAFQNSYVSGSAASDSLTVFSDYVINTKDATAGNAAISAIAAVKIEPGDSLPNVAGSSVSAQPTFAPLIGTDTAFLIYCHWANQSNTDSADIVCRMTANKGVSWDSDRTILKAAVDGDQIMRLQSTRAISYDGLIVFYCYWTDSVTGTGIDSLEVMKVVWNTGYPPPSTGYVPTAGHYYDPQMMERYEPRYVGKYY